MREWLEAFLLVGAWFGMVGFFFGAIAFLIRREPDLANIALIAMAAWIVCGIAANRLRPR